MRTVTVTVTNLPSGSSYLARSYPTDDANGNGLLEHYATPIYKVHVQGTNATGTKVTKSWDAIRFAPFYNNPHKPTATYKTLGWANAGLSSLSRRATDLYDPTYTVHNTHSAFNGAIRLKGNFLIHAGPLYPSDSGWGSAGCVEIIGNFNDFKGDIASLSGLSFSTPDEALSALVKSRRLFVEVVAAPRPDLKRNYAGEF